MPKFYLFAICYAGVRLSINMFGAFLPFYLVDVLKLGVEASKTDVVPFTVALIPLIANLSSVISSFTLNRFYARFGRKMALVTGTVVCSLSLLSLIFVGQSNAWIVYIVSGFVGLSQPYILSTGINFISDVIGSRVRSGAFVYGAYSLFDKFSAGIAIFIVFNTPAYTK
jgi:Na+/melibiose symporter-like transporter